MTGDEAHDRVRSMLEQTLVHLTANAEGDVVDLWRRHSASAASAFLDDLA
ncbi:MAG: hypothetical protein IH940_13250 [Acidobacteria bacterium]|nr:hypothetical protein [Acidobacteriota bacterium]